MANTRKTYGVNGLMEWDTTIPVGKATMKVHFSGGSLTGYGVTPATFTTEDPMKQMIIEKSDYFKSGKIFVVREMEGTGKYKERIVEHHADAGTHMGGVAATAGAVMESPLNPDYKQAQQAETEPVEAVVEKPVEEPVEAETEDGMKIVEVTDIDAARDYLAETFGIARSNIRYKSNVLEKAAELKVKFVGLDE